LKASRERSGLVLKEGGCMSVLLGLCGWQEKRLTAR
jgi:hypothetical protein